MTAKNANSKPVAADATVTDVIALGAAGAVVRLETPIMRGEQTIDSLTLRKPSAGELRGIKLAELLQMDVGSLSTLLPRITSPILTPADVAKLDPADLVTIATEVGSFFLTKATRASLTA